MNGFTLAALAANPAVVLISPRKSKSRKQSLCCKPGNNPYDPKHPFYGCQPGAQPGNSNALKHVFYSRRFSNSECLDLETLSQDGLGSEIAMLRIVARRVLDLSSGVEDLETAFKLLALLS